MSSLKIQSAVFFVRSMEQIFCPCCGGNLNVIGSRRRKYIKSSGESCVLIIRRLRCQQCNRIHHELPDILVPYKRYDSASIETVVTGSSALSVAADESTIVRWRSWFRSHSTYFLGCLDSIAIRFCQGTNKGAFDLPRSVLQKIWQHTGNLVGWLGRIVRPITNVNLWVHTRSAFLS
jgi:uncharacterized protein YbaR (Trm112 family)